MLGFAMTPALVALLAIGALTLIAGAAEAVSISAHRGDLVLVKQALYSSELQVYTPGGSRRVSLPTKLQIFSSPMKTAVSLDGKLAFTTIDNGTPRYGYEPGTKLYDILVTRIAGGTPKHVAYLNLPGLGTETLNRCQIVGGGSGAIAAGTPIKVDSKTRYPIFVAINCNTCGSKSAQDTASRSYILKLQYDPGTSKLSSHGRILASEPSGGNHCTANQAAAVKALSVQRRLGADALFAVIMEQNGRTFNYNQLAGKITSKEGRHRLVASYRHSNAKCFNFAASSLGSFLAVCPSGTIREIIRVSESKKPVTTTTHSQTVGTLPGSNTAYTFGTSGSLGGPTTVDAVFSFDKLPLGRGRRKNFSLPGKSQSFFDITVVP